MNLFLIKNLFDKYSFFHEADLLFYPGEAFERKMKTLNPKFKNGLPLKKVKTVKKADGGLSSVDQYILNRYK